MGVEPEGRRTSKRALSTVTGIKMNPTDVLAVAPAIRFPVAVSLGNAVANLLSGAGAEACVFGDMEGVVAKWGDRVMSVRSSVRVRK